MQAEDWEVITSSNHINQIKVLIIADENDQSSIHARLGD